MDQLSESAGLLPFWNHLSNNDKSLLVVNSKLHKYQHNTVIHTCDGTHPGFMFVLNGMARASLISTKGREISLFKLNKGDFCSLSPFGVMCQIAFDTQIVALTNVDALIIDPNVFKRIMEGNIHVCCYFYELMANRFSTVMWVMQQILFWGVDKRMASYFISEYKRNGSTIIRMTQEEIAEEINTAREVVARMLTRFFNEKVIDLKRGEIYLLDIDRLNKLASMK